METTLRFMGIATIARMPARVLDFVATDSAYRSAAMARTCSGVENATFGKPARTPG